MWRHGIARRVNVLPTPIRHLPIEYVAAFFECCEGIGGQNFCPLVHIVPSGIAPRFEQMGEVKWSVARDDPLWHASFLQVFMLRMEIGTRD